MTEPAVSIVLPTKNRVNLLNRAIESVFCQSLEEWELNIIDSSTDKETSFMVEKYSRLDKRIKYHYLPSGRIQGISEFLNFGINVSKGKYIARLDDDDIWVSKDKLKIQTDFFEMNPDYVLTGGGVIMVNENIKELYRYLKNESDDAIRKNALLACPLEHTTVMFRKDAAISAGGYGAYKVAEDWDFFLKLGLKGKLYNFKEYFTYYMQGKQNISLKDQGEVALTEIEIIKKFRHNYPGFHKGFCIHYIQYLYSFFPDTFKKQFQFFLRYIKRKYI